MHKKILNKISRAVTSFMGGVIFLGFSSQTAKCVESKTDTIGSSRATLIAHSEAQEPLFTLDMVLNESNTSARLRHHMVSFLSDFDQAQMRLIAHRYKNYIDLSFFGSLSDSYMQVLPFSSEISQGTIGSNIFSIIMTAKRSVIIASDKCTNEEFLDDLLTLHNYRGDPLNIQIVTGQDSQTQAALGKLKYSLLKHQPILSNSDNSGKMHNKFIIVDDEVVITGSPNLTLAAYNYNVESFVMIRHKFVAGLYFRYYEYITSGKDKYDHTQEEYRRVGKMMHAFNNAPHNPIQVCLAPILDIKTFVIGELYSSQIIDINMFLVSRASTPDNDIVDNLLKAARDGTQVTIKVDGGQYKTMSYMRKALKSLKDDAHKICTVSKVSQTLTTRTQTIKTKPQFHDKLVLMRHRDGSKKVFIGSAGFTDNVQDNLNFENMVLLRIPEIYDRLFDHFSAVNDSRDNLIVTEI